MWENNLQLLFLTDRNLIIILHQEGALEALDVLHLDDRQLSHLFLCQLHLPSLKAPLLLWIL